MGLKINGIDYDVGLAGVSRSLRREEKYRVTTEDGVVHREVRATYLDFTLSVGNLDSSAYDALLRALYAADGDVTVELPCEASTVEVYTGTFDGISDEAITQTGDETLWDNLSLHFTGTQPLEV